MYILLLLLLLLLLFDSVHVLFQLRAAGAVSLAEGIPKLKNVKLLDISDNGESRNCEQ